MISQSLGLSKKPHVVIATPGRLADLLNSGSVEASIFKNMKYLVLDEADRVLEPTFANDLESIVEKLPPKHQTLLFRFI